jgi:hypothetical protein
MGREHFLETARQDRYGKNGGVVVANVIGNYYHGAETSLLATNNGRKVRIKDISFFVFAHLVFSFLYLIPYYTIQWADLQ